jgi:hypothetical protein
MMLEIPEWFTVPSWVKDFDDLRLAIQKAHERRQKRLQYRKVLRAVWRLAKARHAQ